MKKSNLSYENNTNNSINHKNTTPSQLFSQKKVFLSPKFSSENDDPNKKIFSIDCDDKIMSIEIKYGSLIDSLKFKTKKNKIETFGGNGGEFFSIVFFFFYYYYYYYYYFFFVLNIYCFIC
jgi:hypothetical protein